MNQVVNPPRIGVTDANPLTGRVFWSPVKSLWLTGMTLAAVVGGAATFSWDALLLFIFLTGAVLLFGHSLGMHRKLIHDSYQCPLWLEHFLVYCGVLVGMAGPYGMVRTHDLRDWAQRQPRCHPYLANAGPALRDAWWQLHCEIRLKQPPELRLEPRIAGDRFYHHLERTWMLHHLFWAALLFVWGGWAYVYWGACGRVAVCVSGHWLIGYFAHNHGERTHHVEGAAAQGYNIRVAALITMGEAWHNNHHAFPGSARLGIYPGETDPGWWVLRLLRSCGLVRDIRLPEDLPARAELMRLPAFEPERPQARFHAARASRWLRAGLRRKRREIGMVLFMVLYMLPFTLLFALGLGLFQEFGSWLCMIYGPPFIALWVAVIRYPGFKRGSAPFDLSTFCGKSMIGLLYWGVLAAIVSLILAFALRSGVLADVFGLSGFIGLPAALFASAVLLKTWKERHSVCW